MRCSGWSSLAISACSALALGALVLAGPAAAHVVALSPYVYADEARTLDLEVPNERNIPMTGFIVLAPKGFAFESTQPENGWTQGTGARIAGWHGGSLAPGDQTTFSLEVVAPATPGPATLRSEQHYPDGRIVRWDVPLTVLPAPEAAPSQNLGLAVIAGLVGLLALTALSVLLWRRRTSPVGER